MKTRIYIAAVTTALAATLGCSAVNAQILGGNAAGGLGGTLSGGLRDASVMTQGGADGSFGTDFDAGSSIGTLRRTTSSAADRTQSTVGKAKEKSELIANSSVNKASEAAATARQTELPQVDATSAASGSLASAANVAGSEASGALGASQQAQALSAPVDSTAIETPAETSTPAATSTEAASSPSLLADTRQSGSANGSANVSKGGASASASADANGAADASIKR